MITPPPPQLIKRSLLRRNKWLIARRLSQFSLLIVFLLGPWYGIWWVKGNLASSITLNTLSLSDPFIFIQSFASGHIFNRIGLIGALTVAVFYFLVGGRVYCSWVCPINIITDLAHWLRVKLRIPAGWQPRRSYRLWVMMIAVAVSAITSTIAWELVNPITMVHRGLVYGMGLAWVMIMAVFLFDLLVSRRGWCSHMCPVGAFYGLLGSLSIVRISAYKRGACTDCGDCFRVCPEPHVIIPGLKGSDSPVITSGDCTNCGRCIDICDDNVFKFAPRFATKVVQESGP